jgi:hypothetical protein
MEQFNTTFTKVICKDFEKRGINKEHYDFKNVQYLGDDFEQKGRLSFNCKPWRIQKLMVLSKLHKNSPKQKVTVKRITKPQPITEEIKKAVIERLGFLPKTLKVGSLKEIEIEEDAFSLTVFIKALRSTDIEFIYEPKGYIDNQAVINQHKPLMFNPKRKRK